MFGPDLSDGWGDSGDNSPSVSPVAEGGALDMQKLADDAALRRGLGQKIQHHGNIINRRWVAQW